MARYFYRITVILRDGKTMEGVREHTSPDVDTVYLIYQRQAEDRFEGNLDHYDCVQLSTRSKEVKKFLKESHIHTITHDHHPEEEWWLNTPLDGPLPPKSKSRKESMNREFGKKR